MSATRNNLCYFEASEGPQTVALALLPEGPIVWEPGLKPNVWSFRTPYTELAKLGNEIGRTGRLSLCDSTDQPALADVKIDNCRIVDCQPLDLSEVVNAQGVSSPIFAEYRLTIADWRDKFVSPRGGRLKVGLVMTSFVDEVAIQSMTDPVRGDTWTLESSNGGLNWTKTFFDRLGRPYRVEKSAPADAGTDAIAFATTEYDGNGRVSRTRGFDGTITLYRFDFNTGLTDVILDMDRDGKYTPVVDRKSTTRIADSGDQSGIVTKSLADSGVSTSTTTTSNHGLDGKAVVNGQTATSAVEFLSPGEGEGYRVTTKAPDLTRTVETYKSGFLISTERFGTSGSTPITSEFYGYDALGRLETVYDPAWGTTTYERRPDGTVSKITFPDGRTQVFANFDDKTNAPTAVTRPGGGEQSQTLNDQGRQATQEGSGLLPLRMAYHAQTGQMTSLKTFRSGELDGSGAATTQWSYDNRTGLLKTKTWADNSQDVYTYNGGFQQTGLTRPGQSARQSATFTYNNAGESQGSTYADSSYGSIINGVLTRDDAGRALLASQFSQGVGLEGGSNLDTSVAAYTNLDQLKLDKSGGTGAGVVYEYYGPAENAAGQAPGALKSITLKRGATVFQKLEYAYDSVSKRLATITLKSGSGTTLQSFDYAYKAQTDLVESLTIPGVGQTSWTYEPQTGRLQNLSVTNVLDDTPYQAGYSYNGHDQRSGETVSYSTPGGGSVSYAGEFGYDAHDQLATAAKTYTSGGLTNESYSYTYDGVGNRTSANGAASAFNNLNQNTDFNYDARGNLLGDGVQTYTWDALDRLTSVTKAGGLSRVEFEYDGQNRRTEKRVYGRASVGDPWSLTSTIRYAWEGERLIAEFDSNNTLRTSYVWGMGGLAGGLLAVTDHTPSSGPQTYTAIHDATGSLVGYLDSTGAVAATFRYDPYGVLLSADGTANNVGSYRYAGGQLDEETNLQYHLNRYYSPGQGRFLNRDPIAEGGGVNVYAYAGGDPLNSTDAKGLEPSEPQPVHTWENFGKGQLRSDGRFFKLSEPVPDINGMAKHYVHMKGRVPNFSQWSQQTIRMYISGDPSFDRIQSQQFFKQAYGTVIDLDELRIHHDGLNLQKVRTSHGIEIYKSEMQAVPKLVNQTPHIGSASMARQLREVQNISPSQYKELVEHLNSNLLKQMSSAPKPVTQSAIAVPAKAVSNSASKIVSPASAGVTLKAIGVIGVFTSLRDAAKEAGIGGYAFGEINAPYYFTDNSGSVFVARTWKDGIANLWKQHYEIEYIAGPRTGHKEEVDEENYNIYQWTARQKWGELIKGGIFTEPRFKPGTDRESLPVVDPVSGAVNGWVDEDGVHIVNYDLRGRV
ncbi:RHS repeat domain-containing protein [Humisphaera borealis]|uniref:Teneurin-like YD-shell domain-containing protein n=1 Tax=Humisphaera borealis TaxID=2807512 RepID=A0A7M2WTE9_9BACT|nr:RHS repeat-associated core domain-containing protein [Humisphaera borealis]QOV88442.1 hypothetical protein IPV69_19630 [Humisphaera borealis]